MRLSLIIRQLIGVVRDNTAQNTFHHRNVKSKERRQMKGFRFTKFTPRKDPSKNTFENLLNIFLQLVTMTGGDVAEALSCLTNLDNRYGLTNPEYGIVNFIDDLKDKGYLTEENQKGSFKITGKPEQTIRKSALEEICGKLKRAKGGQHRTPHTGLGEERGTDR